ncbi:MAG: TonB-dependent receptor [Bacteroides sp.]|nr:TonB-dependent receptor [Bacteroides sp.]
MKITFICLFICVSQLFAVNSAAQNSVIQLKTDHLSIGELFREIEEQTDYLVVYSTNDVRAGLPVSVSKKSGKVSELLNEALEGQELKYELKDNYIIVSASAAAQQDGRKVSGQVVDAQGEPIIGANVVVKGTSNGVITDIDGRYTLNGVPADAVILFSYIGYQSTELKASDKNIAKVVLQEDSKLLEEVVVVGYGKQSEKLVTTSISSLKVDEVDQGNDYNVAKMLQGRTPGVNVSTPSGIPGQQPNVRVRGIASISGSATPLYVVDGVPSDNMPYLNPNDIERMDVLKDASATAIYGSRANNGVIIITTKSGGNNEKTSINASVRHSIGWIANDIEMANSEEYIRTLQQAVDNWNTQFADQIAAGKKKAETFLVPDNIQDTDWMSYLQRNAAHTTNANINLQGGNKKTTFFVSAGLNDQQGILRKTAFQQTNMRAKFSHIINNVFKVNVNLSGSYTKEELSEESDTSLKIIRSAREQQPWISPYQEDGSYTKQGTHLLRHNPVMVLDEEDIRNNRFEGIGTVSFDITPFKGFKYTPSFSAYGKFSDGRKTMTEKHDARSTNASWGALSQAKNTTYRFVIDNVFSYDNTWDKLIYSVMLGHSFEKYAYEQFGARSDNYKDNAYPSSSFGLINSGTAIYAGSIGYNAYAIESYFGRIALNWDNRYILNATVRSDGSSRFSKNNRYGTFPSASLAWRVSNEAFYPEDALVNDLKVRLSWGNTGSMAGISDWAAMSLVSSSSSSSYNGSAGFSIGNEANNLTWEKSTQYNFGVDAELFNGRMKLGLDAYYQRTHGLLYATNMIATSGYSSRTANKGKIENKGLEFIVSGDILTGDFKWDMSANISWTKNKLKELDGVLDMEIVSSGNYVYGGTYHALIVGKPVSAYYMYKMEGLYQKDSEVPEKLYAKGVRAGDVKYNDLNNDGDITEDDRQYVGKVTPDFTGGITSNMSWKGFDLSIFCQYSVGGKTLAVWRGAGGNEGTESLGYGGGQSFKIQNNGKTVACKTYFNNSKYASNNYWHGEGTSNEVPRPVLKTTFTGGFANYLTSTRYLEDSSYFKFKTITLGYNLPKGLLEKVNMKAARVYVSLDNFFTLTDYSGYDPEFSYSSSPAGGSYGADFGEQATLKSFIIGASFNF